jgi:hypothetical protein
MRPKAPKLSEILFRSRAEKRCMFQHLGERSYETRIKKENSTNEKGKEIWRKKKKKKKEFRF